MHEEQNGIGGFFKKIIEFIQKKFSFSCKRRKLLNTLTKGASGKGKNKESEIFSILETLIENRRKIIQNYILGEKKRKFYVHFVAFESQQRNSRPIATN